MVVDDYREFARLVADLLGESCAVRCETSVAGALEQMRVRRFEGYIIDLRLADGSGWTVAELARTLSPGATVLILTALEDSAAVNRAQVLGVELAFKRCWKPSVTSFRDRMLAGLRADVDWRTRQFAAKNDLSKRELDVLGLYVGDYERSEIAERLGIRMSTVEAHLRSILRKAGVRRISSVRRRIRREASPWFA